MSSSTKSRSENPNRSEEKNKDPSLNIYAHPSAKNFRDHGSYFSFHVVPRKNGNIRNTPNLVMNYNKERKANKYSCTKTVVLQ